ncbi:MAG: YciI family protein [Bacteroidota bacterium]
MNKLISSTSTLLCALILIVACQPTSDPVSTENLKNETSSVEESGYDSLAAVEYGADDYGMKKYVMAFLKKGPNRTLDSLKAQELQTAHLENITKMAEAGKLVLAGPFLGDGELRGIYIFNVPTIAEAQALTNTDPAIQAGSLEMELLEWYGSAAVMAINDIHTTLMKTSITE